MPEKGCALDMQRHDLKASDGDPWLGLYSEVQDGPLEVAHMLHICLAEAAEVVLPQEVGGSLLHGPNVQLAMLHDEVLVAPLRCIKPGHSSVGGYRPVCTCRVGGGGGGGKGLV